MDFFDCPEEDGDAGVNGAVELIVVVVCARVNMLRIDVGDVGLVVVELAALVLVLKKALVVGDGVDDDDGPWV